MEKESCIADYMVTVRKKMDLQNKNKIKEERNKIQQIKNGLKTPADWKNELQKLFNKYVRLRDEGLPCISCGCDMSNRKGDASHYYAVSIAPSLRFDEDNVHLSCVPCNQYKSGNLIEYGLRLPNKIGKERFGDLLNKKNTTLNLSLAEIKDLIILYKSKILTLQKKV